MRKKIIYGENDLGFSIPTLKEIFLRNIFSIQVIWEIFSAAIWISVNYYSYATIFSMFYFYLFISSIRNDIKNKNEMISNNKITTIRILRGGAFEDFPETEVLPGDIICIDTTDNFKCDTEILKGDVITDESFLTGESVPICKGSGSIVYSGTRVVRSTGESISLSNVQMEKLVKVKNLTKKQSICRDEDMIEQRHTENVAIGLVIKTGKRTKRGLLLKNVLIRKPPSSKFSIQSAFVTNVLLLFAILAMLFIFVYLYSRLSFKMSWRYASDMGLTFFSPTLRTILEMGIQNARERLQKKKINTTEPERK